MLQDVRPESVVADYGIFAEIVAGNHRPGHAVGGGGWEPVVATGQPLATVRSLGGGAGLLLKGWVFRKSGRDRRIGVKLVTGLEILGVVLLGLNFVVTHAGISVSMSG